MPDTQVNEFALNLPMVSPSDSAAEYGVDPAYADQAAVVMTPAATQDISMAIGSPDPVAEASSITVYANSINPISYSGDSTGIAAFDVVFSVGVACGDGSCKTYQVVKRIGIDKARIAAEVQNSAPMSIVEAKKEEPKKPALNETVLRARRLAGLA